jgi:phosphoribosyl-ATP pyrophosphohydrolase
MQDILENIYEVIKDRRQNPKEGSYVNYLQKEGVDKICKKIGEEAAEVIIAAKNNDKAEIVYELSDLYFHSLVLLEENGIKLEDIAKELEKRFK